MLINMWPTFSGTGANLQHQHLAWSGSISWASLTPAPGPGPGRRPRPRPARHAAHDTHTHRPRLRVLGHGSRRGARHAGASRGACTSQLAWRAQKAALRCCERRRREHARAPLAEAAAAQPAQPPGGRLARVLRQRRQLTCCTGHECGGTMSGASSPRAAATARGEGSGVRATGEGGPRRGVPTCAPPQLLADARATAAR